MSVLWVDEDLVANFSSVVLLKQNGVSVKTFADASSALIEIRRLFKEEKEVFWRTEFIIDVMLVGGYDQTFAPEKCDGGHQTGIELAKVMLAEFGQEVARQIMFYTRASDEVLVSSIVRFTEDNGLSFFRKGTVGDSYDFVSLVLSRIERDNIK